MVGGTKKEDPLPAIDELQDRDGKDIREICSYALETSSDLYAQAAAGPEYA